MSTNQENRLEVTCKIAIEGGHQIDSNCLIGLFVGKKLKYLSK